VTQEVFGLGMELGVGQFFFLRHEDWVPSEPVIAAWRQHHSTSCFAHGDDLSLRFE
jgi:hypothetical protein